MAHDHLFRNVDSVAREAHRKQTAHAIRDAIDTTKLSYVFGDLIFNHGLSEAEADLLANQAKLLLAQLLTFNNRIHGNAEIVTPVL